jgi:thioredoxin 1
MGISLLVGSICPGEAFHAPMGKPGCFDNSFPGSYNQSRISSFTERAVLMSRIVEVTDDNFEQEVLQADQPVFVDFWAVWCGPCRMIAPVFEELSEEYAGKVKFVKVNVDEVTKSVANYGIMSIPTLMLFKDGQPEETLVGVQPKEKLAEVLDSHL